MTYQDPSSQILSALDAVAELQWNQQLLEIAIEHCETYTEQNFDRVALLLEHLRTIHDCHLTDLKFMLDELNKTFSPCEILQDIKTVQRCKVEIA